MLAVKNVKFPGADRAVTIMIDGGKIKSVEETPALAGGVNVIDAEGLYAIPGLIDAHTHFGGSSTFDHPGCGGAAETYRYAAARESFLDWGVTAVRSCGDQAADLIAYRDQVRAGAERSPRIVCCGPFFQAVDGHPWATGYMRDPALVGKAFVFADEGSSVEEQVAAIADSGVDFVKVMYAHLNNVEPGKTSPRLTKQQLCRAVQSAHRAGIKCAVHIDGPLEMLDAAEAGADAIEHVINPNCDDTELTPEIVAKVKESGAVVTPTVISTVRFEQISGSSLVGDKLKKAVIQLYDAGIPLAVGCDSGIPFIPFGESLHDEMECLAGLGIPAAEILRMVSETNAKLLGLETELGSIEAGKCADLVLLGADPAVDIRNTRDIRMVIQSGRILIDRL